MADDGGAGAFGNQDIDDELLQELQVRLSYYDMEDAQLNAELDAQRSVRYYQGVGKFLIPRENSWMAHRSLVLDKDIGIYYSPKNFPFFDRRIANLIDYEPVTDSANRRYPAYDVLRENVAIVRNYIMSEFFKDGSVDQADEKKVRQLAQIGDFLGNGMKNDSWLPNPLAPRISKARANMPGSGAQYLYQQIKNCETYHSWLAPITTLWRILTFQTTYDWELPPLNESPFSNDALRMPPPSPMRHVSDEQLAEICASMDVTRGEKHAAAAYANGINHLADDFANASALHQDVNSLQEPTKRESIDLAKDILRKLKVKIGEAFIEQGLTPQAAANFSILEALRGVVSVYEFHLHKLSLQDPAILDHPNIRRAGEAIGKLGYVAKLEALRVAELQGDTGLTEQITKQLLDMPPSWHSPTEKMFKELLEQLESGLDQVTSRLLQRDQLDNFAENGLGRLNHKAIGTIDPEFEASAKTSQAIASDDYFRAYQAQREQAALNTLITSQQNKQQLGRDIINSAASNAPKLPEASRGMDQLVGSSDVAGMRSAMKTDPNAQMVAVRNAARRQAIVNQERVRREQAQRQARIKAAEHAKQADKRADAPIDAKTEKHKEAAEHKHDDPHHHEPLATPSIAAPMSKKDKPLGR